MCGILIVPSGANWISLAKGGLIDLSQQYALPGHPGYQFRLYPAKPGATRQQDYILSITREGSFDEVRREWIPASFGGRAISLTLCLDQPAFPVRMIWRQLCAAGVDPGTIHYEEEGGFTRTTTTLAVVSTRTPTAASSCAQ